MNKVTFKPELVLINFEDRLKKAVNASLSLAVKSDDKILKGEALGLLDALTLFKQEWKAEYERNSK